MKKRILSLLIVISLFCGLIPTQVFAADEVQEIMSGTSGIEDPTQKKYPNKGNYYVPSDYIYFGTYEGTPIEWRVLDADTTNFGTPGLFLLSQNLLGTGTGGGVIFDEDEVANAGQINPNEWQGSDAQKWCDIFTDSSFESIEAEAILPATKWDAAESVYLTSWDVSTLNNDKVFFLSAKEAFNYVGDYSGAIGLSAKYNGKGKTWWLRSPRKGMEEYAGTVSSSGSISYSGVDNEYTARPALNLDIDSILFTSAAAGGKSASGMENGLTEVPDYDGNEWKLTLKDDSRSNFTISRVDSSTISYANAVTGTNEYISAVIKDDASGMITHYGRLKNITQANEASGTLTIDLSQIDMTGKSLYIFNEQYNGDKKTDYASELKVFVQQVIIYDVSFNANGGSGNMDDVTDITGEYVLPDCGFSAPKGKQFKAWAENSVNGMQYNAGATYTGNGDTEFYAIWEDIPAYSISADVTTIDFQTSYVGDYRPEIKTVTITNTGNQLITLTQPTANYFEIGNLSQTILAPGEKSTFTVQKKSQLNPDTYKETLMVFGSNNVSEEIVITATLKKRDIVAFAGYEWWVIGDSEGGVQGPNKDSITLFSKNNDFDCVPFRNGSVDPAEGYTLYQNVGSLVNYYANNPSGMSAWKTPNEYLGSTLQQKIESITEGFSEKELQLMLPRTITAADSTLGPASPDQKLWAVSIDERDAINNTEVWKYDGKRWWTRSGVGDDIPDYSTVAWIDNGQGGSVSSWFVGSSSDIAVRPAMYLDMSSFLFSSAADASGKSSASVGEGLIQTMEPTGAEKFTMIDEDLSLTVSATEKQSTQTGNELIFDYSDATIGSNNFISCILRNEDGFVEYYGKLEDCSKDTEGTLCIPLSKVSDGTYILEIFCEQVNGDLYTDFASKPVTMKVTVKNSTGTVGDFSGNLIIEYAAAPTISVGPQDGSYIIGDAAQPITVSASVTDGGTISYQWYKNTVDNNTTGEKIEGATAANYIPSTDVAGTTYYYCVVTNTNNKAIINTTASTVSDTAKIVVSVDSQVAQTGDNGNMLLWIVWLSLSGVGMLAISVYFKKKTVKK